MYNQDKTEILLVEDSDSDAELTLRALKQKNLANNVIRVKDGAEALDFIFRKGEYATRSDHRPKLILLDIKMPKVDGIEVLRQIKANPHTAVIPVVIMTSSTETPDLTESYRLGVNSFVVKPVDFQEFVDQVSKAGCYWLLVNKVPPE